jgi:membrane protein implicated in regulation of membrane protease activity
MNWLAQAEYWHWWVLGVVLLILEVFSPGAFFLWLGLAAGVVGAVLLLLPDLDWQLQLLLFAVLSVVSIVAGRSWLRRHPIETDLPTLNRRGEQYVGRVFTLEQPVVNGTGKIRVDDTTWKIRGDDREAGSRVRVTGVDGTVLLVDSAD